MYQASQFLVLETVHLAIALLICLLVFLFLRKHGKKLGKAAILLLISVFALALFQAWEVIIEFFGISDLILQNAGETLILCFLAIALILEMKMSEKAKE